MRKPEPAVHRAADDLDGYEAALKTAEPGWHVVSRERNYWLAGPFKHIETAGYARSQLEKSRQFGHMNLCVLHVQGNAQEADQTCRMELTEVPITDDWLRENGFEVIHAQHRFTLDYGEGHGFTLDVDVTGNAGWRVWISESGRAPGGLCCAVRYTWELIRLWEGLTGKSWQFKERK